MTSIIEALKAHLTGDAQQRTIRQVVSGGRFCAVMLDDGGVGVANICPDACGEPMLQIAESLPQPGMSATDALERLGSSASAIGLATANALANRSRRFGGRWDERSIGGDLLDTLVLTPDDHVGMIGCFYPLVDPIRQRGCRLSIFERGPRLASGCLPEEQAPERLPDCSVAIITATTLINGTIDGLLAKTTGCREVVLLGPSTPLVPEVFAGPPRLATLLAGMVALDAERLLPTVASGGGTRDFGASAAKVNVRV